MAFIFAGLVAAITIAFCLLELFAAGMSSNPQASASVSKSAMRHFAIGMLVAALIAGSHWLPHIGW